MMSSNEQTMETTTMQLWMDQEAEGTLAADEQIQLDRAVDADSDLAADRTAFGRLHRLITPEPIDVPSDFVARVMDNLPVADWEKETASQASGAQGVAAWQLPLAAMLAFAVGAAFLLSGIDSALLGTGAAIADFLQTTALAGAGLLEASWRSVGLGLEEMFADSPATVAAFAGVVFGIDVLFVSLLLRRKPEAATENVSNDD